MQYETFSARAELEHAIAAAIDLLDLIDPDSDLEETGDLEPSLAGNCLPRMEVDLEGDEHDGREPDEDFELNGDEHEPSLGSLTSSGGNQENWAGGAADDREGEHDGAEPEEGDYGGDGPSDDDPIFPSLGVAVEREAHEMRRVAAFIEGRCRRLITSNRQGARS